MKPDGRRKRELTDAPSACKALSGSERIMFRRGFSGLFAQELREWDEKKAMQRGKKSDSDS